LKQILKHPGNSNNIMWLSVPSPSWTGFAEGLQMVDEREMRIRGSIPGRRFLAAPIPSRYGSAALHKVFH
jgi:hypothetical protein